MKAVGDFVILQAKDSESESGIIYSKHFVVDSLGSSVPVLLSVGNTVIFNTDSIKVTLDDGRVCVHYQDIYAYDKQNWSVDEDFADYVVEQDYEQSIF